MSIASRLSIPTLAVVIAVVPHQASAQEPAPSPLSACYMPSTGLLYMIGLPGLPAECRSADHIALQFAPMPAGAANKANVQAASEDDPAAVDEPGTSPDHLPPGTITTPDLANGAVTSLKILNGTIAAADLAVGAVTSSRIRNGGVATADLASAAVTSDKIADGAVDTRDLAERSVTPSRIRYGAVNTDHIADGAVTAEKLAPGVAEPGWALRGNAGTDPSTDFIGTIDTRPLKFRVNDQQVLRIDRYAGAHFSGSFVGSAAGTIPASGPGARLMWYPGKAAFRVGRVESGQWNENNVGIHSIALGLNTKASGGGSTAMGRETTASAAYATAMGRGTSATAVRATALGMETVASGANSTAMGLESVASGENSVAMGTGGTASGRSSTAMGSNTTASGDFSTAMGQANSAIGTFSTAMGQLNSASGDYSTAMGLQSAASGDLSTTIGYRTEASGSRATAMGSNTTASGHNSTALGTATTASGGYSTAVGTNASTNGKEGSFVYGDASTLGSSVGTLEASADHQFSIRASGGVRFFTNSNLTSGVRLTPGSGSWAVISDRDRKRDFRDEDGEATLAKIAEMPIQSWSYLAQDPSIRHLGPVAQDFFTAFGLGDSDTTITTSDLDGVNMLAIQALERRTADLRVENEELRQRLAEVESMLSGMRR